MVWWWAFSFLFFSPLSVKGNISQEKRLKKTQTQNIPLQQEPFQVCLPSKPNIANLTSVLAEEKEHV